MLFMNHCPMMIKTRVKLRVVWMVVPRLSINFADSLSGKIAFMV